MQCSDLIDRLHALGANSRHEQHLLRTWVQALPLQRGRRRMQDYLPKALREAWPGIALELAGLATVDSSHEANDGSIRMLVRLRDGESVESVLLPRDGLCVSTQVGCAVGCQFCMTGRGGLLRHLGSAEIVAQVALARRQRTVSKVVFMGMGEPAHNLEAVMESIELLGTAGAVGHKNLVFSTVGDVRVFERLLSLPQGRVKPALALSLHTTMAALRQTLLPRAPRLDPAELVALGEVYARATGYPIQYQWTLLDGVNDGDDEIEGIVHLLAGRYAMMNLIPYNEVEGLAFARPAADRAARMARALNQRGIYTRLRQSAGQDVQAGCGQLRARAATPPTAGAGALQTITMHR